MPVILDETLADFDLLAFEVYVQVDLKIQHTGGVGGGGWGERVSCVFKKCLNELPYRESYKLNSPDHGSLH